MGVEALSKQNQQYRNVYQNQNEFNNYFLSTFDKYDKNRVAFYSRIEHYFTLIQQQITNSIN